MHPYEKRGKSEREDVSSAGGWELTKKSALEVFQWTGKLRVWIKKIKKKNKRIKRMEEDKGLFLNRMISHKCTLIINFSSHILKWIKTKNKNKNRGGIFMQLTMIAPTWFFCIALTYNYH